MGFIGAMEILKLVPRSVSKPWGLHRGVGASEVLRPYSIGAGVGELWLASAQTGPGNYSNAVVERTGEEIVSPGQTIAQVLDEAVARGEDELRGLLGECAFAILKKFPHRGKTEAWAVREAVGHTGVASGPRTSEQLDQLRQLVLRRELGPDIENWAPDVRRLLGLVEPLQEGEAFLVPCGTLHTMFAIGADSRLVIDEIQQGYGTSLLPTLSKILMVQDNLLSVQVHPCDETVSRFAAGELQVDQDLEANPTVRVYDFGRRPGEYPELGLTLTDTNAGLRRVTPVEVDIGAGAILEVMVACAEFVRSRLTLPGGAECDLSPTYGSYRVLHCMSGSCCLEAGDRRLTLAAAETAFVPGELETGLRIRAKSNCRLLDDAVPNLESLCAFLSSRDKDTDALLEPPLALGGASDCG